MLIKSKINKRPSRALLCQARACHHSWGRLAGRGQIETRQREDDKLEQELQENDTQYSFLFSHRVLKMRLMLFMHTQMSQLLSHPYSLSVNSSSFSII